MESISETEIDIFGESLPSLEDIAGLANDINSSEINRIKFAEQLQSKANATDGATCLAAGIGLVILGKNTEAVETLGKGNDCKEKFIYSGYAHRALSNFDEALANFDRAKDHQADTLAITMEKVATLRQALRLEDATKELKNASNFERVSAEYHYQMARLQDAQGFYAEAIDNYQTGLELDPNHPRTLFHLAYACDLRGDEEAAIDYYKQISAQAPAYVSALLNLAILYEDREEYEKAFKCVTLVLKSHPNHKRALLFKKDITSSMTMVYDEEKEQRLDQQNQMLDTPISDFELSVRSRNCLKKMNIHNIGDLLKITEAELLSYKNFGETSLVEIKAILNSKGLRLGMALEDKSMGMMHMPSLPEDADNELLVRSINDIELSVRARKCVQALNIKTVGELIQRTEAELLGCKNFGVTSLNEIKQRLGVLGLSLRQLD